MYCKIEIRFDIHAIEHLKSVIRGLKFAFSDFSSLQIKRLFCHLAKLDASAISEKKVSNETVE